MNWGMWSERGPAAGRGGLDPVPPGRVVPVRTADGVDLRVEVDGPDDAPLTVVFAHGFAVSLESWRYQRVALGDLGRLVFYDQRGHGRSGPVRPEAGTFEQLAADLAAVIDATAPPGTPVILAGHSMGGMSVMALAAAAPELFGDRVIGAALVDTSACLSAPARPGARSGTNPALRAAVRGVRLQERYPVMHRLSAELNGRLVFADPVRHRALVPPLVRIMRSCPAATQTVFMTELTVFDLRRKIGALRRVRTLVIAGARDRLIPLAHKKAIAAALPGTRLAVLRQAGHATILERPRTVNDLLRDLVARATAARPT